MLAETLADPARGRRTNQIHSKFIIAGFNSMAAG
jgi:hypothetical protein